MLKYFMRNHLVLSWKWTCYGLWYTFQIWSNYVSVVSIKQLLPCLAYMLQTVIFSTKIMTSNLWKIKFLAGICDFFFFMKNILPYSPFLFSPNFVDWIRYAYLLSFILGHEQGVVTVSGQARDLFLHILLQLVIVWLQVFLLQGVLVQNGFTFILKLCPLAVLNTINPKALSMST